MNKTNVMNELKLTEVQLYLLEYDYLKVHKEHAEKIIKSPIYLEWYVQALKEWKDKRIYI